MPRGPERQWRKRKDPDTEHLVMASVQGGLVNADRGFYKRLQFDGIETLERAHEIRRSMFRCAKRVGYSLKADVVSTTAGFAVVFFAIDKTKARAWMIKTYGTDRTRWPYNPRRPNPSKGPT